VHRPKPERLEIERLGPIKHADVTFGDLTVIVGPQASGKSIFLQTLKLLKDRDHIHDTFKHNNVVFTEDVNAFYDGYFGNGMSSSWDNSSALRSNGKDTKLAKYAKPSRARELNRAERVFFIPAQRVVSLRNGSTQNFGQFEFGDPYTLRRFSDIVHGLVQNEFGAKSELFPAPNRLNPVLRRPIDEHLFGGGTLSIDTKEYTKRLVLNVPGGKKGLPYLAWSAGQREFTPLLLGLYWLCPVATQRRQSIEWVVIEEPEMGLHPQAIATVLLLILELLRRGYKVAVSTHSPVVLEMVWALQVFKRLHGTEIDVRRVFGLPSTPYSKELAENALAKDYRVYFFDRQTATVDISKLDPGAATATESEWGGLSGFASRAGDVVAGLASRDLAARSRKRVSKAGAFKSSTAKTVGAESDA
jgi:hypothetical protein